MSIPLYIPPVNPVRFFKRNVTDGYVQKYSPLDYTNVQAVTVGEPAVVGLVIKDKYNRNVKTYSPRGDTLIDDHHFYTFAIDFFGLSGNYRIILTVDGVDSAYSGCIHVSTKHEKLPLLQYRNTVNKDDANYAHIEIFSLRVEGGFLKRAYSPKSDDTTYQNQPVSFELLHSDTYFTLFFTAGGPRGIPDDFHYIIHKAWGCDTVYVNGERFTKYSGAEWEVNGTDNYALATWKYEVVPAGGTVFVRTPESSSDTWQDYVCRIQNGVYTGYAAATTLSVVKRGASGSIIDGYPKPYSILDGFVYSETIFQKLTQEQYANLSYRDLDARASAFIQAVISAEGNIEGVTDRTPIPFNLVNGNYNLVNGDNNLITSINVINGLLVSDGSCRNLYCLYIGVTESADPSAEEIKTLETAANANGNIEYSFLTPTLSYAQVWEPESNSPFINIRNDINDPVLTSFRVLSRTIDGVEYRGYIYKYPTIDDVPYHLRFYK
jgi:hypothetical protein